MRRRLARWATALLAAFTLLAGCGAGGERSGTAGGAPAREEPGFAAPSITGALHVEGTQLMGSHGEPVQLRGISTHGLAWFPDYVNEACFAQLRGEWKANVIRLALYTAESGGYCEGGDQEALKQLIRDGVSYAAAQDMYAIVDWHVLHDLTPARYEDQAIAFFDEMSAEFAGQDHVLYEICNEPNGGTPWSEVKAYAEKVIPVIRAHDEDAVILVGTPNWCQHVDQAADPITDYDNLMYTLHFYAATHKGALRETMARAVQARLPVFVSEYGICDASGSGAIDREQADLWVDELDAHGISYVAWNLSNKDESSALLCSSCAKTSGFTEADLSESGRWLYQTLTGREPSARATGEQPEGETPASPAVFRSGSLEFAVDVKNSWEDGGETVCQYEMTITNTSDRACSGWTAEIRFCDEIELCDGWNGVYTADGKILRIRAMNYNGDIPAGGTVGDVGFIVKGGGGHD